MRKCILLALLIATTGVLGYAQQTMWIHTGHVHWAYNTQSVGTMPYSSGSLLTVLEKGFTLADVDSVTVTNETFADDNVLVKYAGSVADVYVAGNIANHITAQVTGARVAVMQDDAVATEYTYTLQGTSSSGCFYHVGKYKMTLVLNGVNLVNPDSAAINIQNSKRIAVQLAEGTTNTLADGANNTKKAAFLVKGHAEFSKGGSLTITGNKKHALACNEYMEVKKTVGNITITGAVADAINVVQYFQMNGGTVNIQSCGDDGIQVDAEDTADPTLDGHVLIQGGTLTINASATATKCIKAEGNIDITGGTLTLNHSGTASWDATDLKIKEPIGISTDRNLTINGDAAVVNITMTGNGTRGMKCDSTLTATAGSIDINCSGQPWAYGTTDTTNVKCAKADYAFILNGANFKCTTSKDEAEGIHSEGTVLISDGTLTLNTYDHGIKCDGNMDITGGTINFTIPGAASKAIKPDGNLHITGGTITGTVSGGGETYNDNSASGAACIKGKGNAVIDGGTFNLTATGAGGKGMNFNGTLTINDGNITVKTTGAKYGSSGSGGGGGPGGGGWNPWGPGSSDTNSDGSSSPKGIRAEGNLTINGGSISVSATGGEGAEGIESKSNMYIKGGYIEVTSYDDALNSASHMYFTGGYTYAVATGNDAIDSNGNMYLSGGYVFCCGSEEGLDANSEGGYKVYIQSGASLMAIGGNMGAIESGASISQTCKSCTASANTWYGLYNGGTAVMAVYTPTFSSQGGGGGWGPGGGSSSSKTMVVTTPSTTSVKSGVTGSGTSFWSGKGYPSATGGTTVSLSSYSGSGW
ncbi:MAG: carbohydrate-binding domain-containing protein [Muribaculaceae bacterium]|nr:carbohydrate-binding domain-containing protein [Muribaculaceae bacterium]